MKAVIRRLTRLEDRLAPKLQPDYLRNPRQRFRIVLSDKDHPLSLETSTCRRTLTAGGVLSELVDLDGIPDGLSDEELEEFIERFPVQTA